MVRYVDASESEHERLERLVRECAARHRLRVEVTGWARKTYDLFAPGEDARDWHLVARIESAATVTGEVRVFDERGLGCAHELAAALEKAFPAVGEARVLREPHPAG
ncbi:MAG: hypothetical protein KatS3mg102_1883 [Planctomycetota bacterium]|nr:MAG: hypothetical protein KatS3mg102_1883 [Planctomycetota bacterium]